MRVDKVASFDKLMAGKAGSMHRLVGRFAVFELSEPPAACRGVFSRVLHRQLKIDGSAGNEGLSLTKDFVVFLRRNVTPGEPRNDCAIGVRQLSFPVGLDRYIVAENDAKVVVVTCLVGHGDHPPVAESGRNFDAVDRRCGVIDSWCCKRCRCAETSCSREHENADPIHETFFPAKRSAGAPAG
jgi:hypothetical protein